MNCETKECICNENEREGREVKKKREEGESGVRALITEKERKSTPKTFVSKPAHKSSSNPQQRQPKNSLKSFWGSPLGPRSPPQEQTGPWCGCPLFRWIRSNCSANELSLSLLVRHVVDSCLSLYLCSTFHPPSVVDTAIYARTHTPPLSSPLAHHSFFFSFFFLVFFYLELSGPLFVTQLGASRVGC